MNISVRILALTLPLLAAAAARAEPETVYFMSADGKTEIVGYLFKPSGPGAASGCRDAARPRRALLRQ